MEKTTPPTFLLKKEESRDFPISHLHLLTQENTETYPAVLLAFSNNGFDKTLHQFPSHFPHSSLANRVNAQHQNGGEERTQIVLLTAATDSISDEEIHSRF